MKTKSTGIVGWFPALLLVLFAITSCIDGYDIDIVKDLEKDVTFTLVPLAPRTYALTARDEEEFKDIELLFFDLNGKYLETRLVAGTAISVTENASSFTVKITEGTYSSLVILANCASIVAGAGLTNADTKASAMAKLTLGNATKWITDNASPRYLPIPFWGELGKTTIDQTTPLSTKSNPWTLKLTRMLAKVSVSLSTPEAINHFKLQSIHVYNFYDKGSVAPLAVNWGVDASTAASVPPSASKPADALVYGESAMTTPSISSTKEIYLFESDNRMQTDLLKRTCLVLGGTYKDGKTYYYRVDFIENTDGGNVFLDVLRNHHYAFNVTKLRGPGHDTPDKAFKARPFNIEAVVVPWNDIDVKNVSTDGQYVLGVSQLVYDLSSNAYTSSHFDNQLNITTDHPTGWSISSILDLATDAKPSWLSINNEDLNGTVRKKKIALLVTENTGDRSRKAKVVIQAGSISLNIQVIQRGKSGMSLAIMDPSSLNELTELLFFAPADVTPSAQQFIVTSQPLANPYTINTRTVGTNAFDFGSGNVPGISHHMLFESNGFRRQLFNIAPPAISKDVASKHPFFERSSRVEFTITDGSKRITKSILLKQINYTLSVSGNRDKFAMDGSEYSLTVRSNYAWKVEVVKDADKVLTSVRTTSGKGSVTGETVSFRLIDNRKNKNKILSATFLLKFISVNNQIPPKSYVIYCINE